MSLSSYFLALVVVITWAYNNIAVKLGGVEIPPICLVTLRFVVVAILVVPFTRVSKEQLKVVVLLAFTFGLMHFSLLFVSLQYAEVGISAILTQLGTPFAILMACVFLKEKIKLKQIIGIFISFVGVVTLAGSPSMPPIPIIILLLGSALGWAVTNVIIKQKAANIPPLTLTAWVSFISIPVVGFTSFIFESGQLEALQKASWNGWFAVFYSAIGSSIFAYSIWYWLLKKYPINQVIPFSLLSPVFSVLFGILLLNEQVNIFKIIGSLLVIGGIFFATVDIKRLIFRRHLPQ
ncbi:DMT family transporter [Zophobihabitans entericus]|uniref:EamA family transporter n=1 Tax=Zophobihabitans entericus TaxID=1635327 RepID=A0A6G9IE10_9GAMM|nr:EamA family transporter [Zophobihabitans entericus]QIQ22049.1 EamA family transporter [Zophobihabitans entericus]